MKSLKLSITLIALFTTSICLGQDQVQNSTAKDKTIKVRSETTLIQPVNLNDHKPQKVEKNIIQKEDPSLKEQETAKANQKAEEKARITAEEERKASEKADIKKSQANALQKSAPLSPDYIQQLLAHKHHGTDGIDGKIDKLIAEGALSTDWEVENRHLAPIYLTLPQIISAYENNTEGIEETVNELLLSGKLSIDVLNENNVDTNSKLYKKLNDHQKIGK